MDNSPISTRLPSLDGWRAFGILMVLGGHTGLVTTPHLKVVLDWMFDGDLGVRFFFVISGFLITWLLLQEQDKTGGIHLRYFYIRRSLRILPVYLAFVLVLAGLQLFTHFHETPAGWLGLLTFTRNYTDGSGASAHCWSLSVEEQFYLVWPGLLVLLHKHSVRLTWIALAIPLMVAPLFRLGSYVFYQPHHHFLQSLNGIHLHPAFLDGLFRNYSFFCYFDTLASGCLCALLLARHPARLAGFFKAARVLIFFLAVLLVAGPHVWGNLAVSAPPLVTLFLMAFGHSLQALGVCLLLLHSVVEPEWPGYRVLNWRPVCWLGVLSYSLYIWQQIIWSRAWAVPEPVPHMAGVAWAWLWLIPTLAVAMISYYYLEMPFFRLRKRYGSSQRSVATKPVKKSLLSNDG